MNGSDNGGSGPRIGRGRSLILGGFILLTTAAYAAKPPDPPPSFDVGGGYIENMGFIPAGENGVSFTNEAIRHMAVSIGQLGGVNPETGEVIINEGNLLNLVARELDITGSAFFYTNIYISGNTYVYGALHGSGTGISNIPVANITGSVADRPEIQEALESKLDSTGVWDNLNTNSADISTLKMIVTALEQASGDTNNPHRVTAGQTGAYSTGDTDLLISNVLVQIHSVGYIATNHAGNISITGSVDVLSLQVVSNVTAHVFYGDGSGLTNLPAANITGSLAERPEILAALESKLDAVGVWASIADNAGSVSNIQQIVSTLTAATPAWDAAYTWGNHAMAGYASLTGMVFALEQVGTNTNNPHQVTAAQLGAYTASETDALISNVLAQIQSAAPLPTNQNGNIDFEGEIEATDLYAKEKLNVGGTASFYTNIYVDGDSVIAGRIFGDGAGLTNIAVDNITGSLAEQPELGAALAAKLDAIGVWSAIHENSGSLSNLRQVVIILDSTAQNWNAAFQWGNHALAGYASHTDVDTLRNSTNNPHQMEPHQIGALATKGGKMSGHIDMTMSNRLINLPEPVNDDEAVTRSYLDKRLNLIIPQGDISMGIYTNFPGY